MNNYKNVVNLQEIERLSSKMIRLWVIIIGMVVVFIILANT